MLELGDKSKIIKNLLVIKQICSWLQTFHPYNPGRRQPKTYFNNCNFKVTNSIAPKSGDCNMGHQTILVDDLALTYRCSILAESCHTKNKHKLVSQVGGVAQRQNVDLWPANFPCPALDL